LEALDHLVAESLARHGLDRPVDPRRLRWSQWFRCESTHSLLVVPSKPGIFAIAEEIMDFDIRKVNGPTAAFACPERPRAERGEAELGCPAVRSEAATATSPLSGERILGGAALQRCDSQPHTKAALAAEAPSRRMLAVLQFSEDDDMAFVLDRMFTRANPMRARLASGLCFLRFVVIEDQAQRRSICNALNQWVLASAEKASGIAAGFSSSLELASHVSVNSERAVSDGAAAPLNSGAATNLHCPHPLPSGF